MNESKMIIETNLLKILNKDFAVLNREDIIEVYKNQNVFDELLNSYGYGVNHNAAILYIKKGKFNIESFDEKYSLNEGDVFIIPAGSIKNAKYKEAFLNEGIECEVIYLSTDFISKYIIPSSISPSFIAILKRDNLLIKDMSGIDEYMGLLKKFYLKSQEDLNGLDHYLMIQSIIYIIKKINHYLIKGRLINKTDRRDEMINKLHDLFLENPTINYNIEEYSQKLYTSKYLLNKVTKEVKGVTAKELVNSWLIHGIKRDLLTTDLIVKEIAVKYGFSESTNFSKFFKRNEKLSISEFYKKNEYENIS